MTRPSAVTERDAGESSWRPGGLARPIAAFVVPAAVILALGTSIPGPLGRDTYFHLAIAEDYAESPFSYRTNIAVGVQSEFTADREPLFHLLLALPLSVGFSPNVAASLLCSICAGLLGLAVYGSTRSLLLVLLCLFASNTFLFRMLMCRPHVLAVPLVLFGVMALRQERYRTLALINFVYGLSYSVPVLLAGAACLYFIEHRRLRALFWILLSAVLAALLHPHFPDNAAILWYQGPVVLANAWLGNPLGISLPDELEPWFIPAFLVDGWFPLAVFVLVSFRNRGRPRWLFSFQILLLLMTLRSMRFVEYWVPLVFLTSRPLLELLLPTPAVLRVVLVVLLVLARPVVGAAAVVRTAADVVEERNRYADAALWLREHADGALVVNLEFFSYPELRFFAPNVRPVQGIDPVFVAAINPEAQEAIARLQEGTLKVDDFCEEFGTGFIVTDRRRVFFPLRGHPWVALVHADEDTLVLQVRCEN